MKLPMNKRFPRELEEILGAEASDAFLDFLHKNWESGGKMLLEESQRRFEKLLSDEIGKIREELSDFKNSVIHTFASARNEIASIRKQIYDLETRITKLETSSKEMSAQIEKTQREIKELRMDFEVFKSDIRAELKHEIGTLRTEMQFGFLNIYKELLKIQETISNQTKWILATALAIPVFLPIISKLIDKYF
ncbi:LA_3696 family protein [Leptospira sarikeiensis]|uniref:DUF1640 domain-containing protein n=1 Tax=Leptospira sarikeiensis TaxID=2484943 RepID=A0A4R9K3T8_9LEPT|nr:hypothetical protein [Leptospira sarikeiensis]TGL60726.1 hypothetical protein EHQ64_12980 [Leptospira sarikeiensis]